MSDGHSSTRRTVLKGAGSVGFAGLTGVGSVNALQGGVIPMGSILPITGALSDFGEGMQAAVNLAAEHINAAGGPLDREIEVLNRDSETRPPAATQKYSALVNEDSIVGFVGAASSGVSVPLAEQVASDQVMQMSHASTSPVLSTLGYNQDESVKYFGRTAPNDAQQGVVMGRILSEDDYVGADTASFLHVGNPYGSGLAETAAENFDGEVLNVVSYAQQTSDFSSTLDSLFEGEPDAVGFIGYPGNGRTILRQWDQGGYGGEWVLSEGLNSNTFLQELSSIVSGMYISSPNPEQTSGATAFEEAIGQQNTLFAPHAYDGLFLMAMAMHAGGEPTGTAIAENIQAVSRPEEDATGGGGGNATNASGNATAGGEVPGEVVTVNEFDRAKQLIDEGADVNYQGASSPVDLNEQLEPFNAFAILQVQEDGSRETLEEIPRSFFEEQM